jgi:exonuclease III
MATFNVNGVPAKMRMGMLADFLRKQENDILLQEINHNDFDLLRGYNAFANAGVNKRGTAILTRQAIQLTNITGLSSGRKMRGFYRGVSIVNIFAPSGSSNRK